SYASDTLSFTSAHVTDPRGQRTTLLFPGMSQSNPTALIDGQGRRTSFAWGTADRFTHVQDGNGQRTTLTWTTLGDQTRRLQSVQLPVGRLTLLYDASNRVLGVVDALARRTTLVRDTNGNRI